MTCIARIKINFYWLVLVTTMKQLVLLKKIKKTVEKLYIYLSVNCKTSSNTHEHEVNNGVSLKTFSDT